MKRIEIPSFSKSKYAGCLVDLLSDGFHSLENSESIVTEIRLNSVDLEILQSDVEYIDQHSHEDGVEYLWTARIVRNDTLDCVVLIGED